MDEQTKQKRPTYSDGFKRDAVRLVAEEGYSFKAACASGGSVPAVVASLALQTGATAQTVRRRCFPRAISSRNQAAASATEAGGDGERDILKKATAFFAKEST